MGSDFSQSISRDAWGARPILGSPLPTHHLTPDEVTLMQPSKAVMKKNVGARAAGDEI